ncbi:MAG: hypothetical protein Q9212_006757 [Teloschistes hypoglaucus]
MALPTLHPSQVNLQRHQECCYCHLTTELLGAPNRCPRCRRTFCGDCIIDTVEPHVYSVDAGNIVIGVPYGPSIQDCYLLEFGPQREARQTRAALAKSTYDGPRRKRVIEETDSSSDDVVEISPPVTPKPLPKRKVQADEDSARPRKRMKTAAPVAHGNQVRPRPATSILGRLSGFIPPSRRKACPSPALKRKLEVVSDSDTSRKRMKTAAPVADDGKSMRPRPANSSRGLLSEHSPPSKRKGRQSPVGSAAEGLPRLRKRDR